MCTVRLDWRAVLFSPLPMFLVWLGMVLAATWAGYPGVVCVTPMAWLMALRVGLVTVAESSSVRPERRLQEAALAGAWFGLLQGILFWVIVPLMGPVQAGERAGALGLACFMLLAGVVAGAGLSALIAYRAERQQRAA